ncbi:MAG: hypothetical protein P0116_09140 [Candidatus Nitrosocosmicus sp.]|nr:hypothetical protein [Candidatus Nitrosocosmicus sp.]
MLLKSSSVNFSIPSIFTFMSVFVSAPNNLRCPSVFGFSLASKCLNLLSEIIVTIITAVPIPESITNTPITRPRKVRGKYSPYPYSRDGNLWPQKPSLRLVNVSAWVIVLDQINLYASEKQPNDATMVGAITGYFSRISKTVTCHMNTFLKMFKYVPMTFYQTVDENFKREIIILHFGCIQTFEFVFLQISTNQ